MFEAAYEGVEFADMNFGHGGNAIAAYELEVFAFNGSPWERFVAGDDCALTTGELRGARHFLAEDRAVAGAPRSGVDVDASRPPRAGAVPQRSPVAAAKGVNDAGPRSWKGGRARAGTPGPGICAHRRRSSRRVAARVARGGNGSRKR